MQRVLAAEFLTLTSVYSYRDTLTFTLPPLPGYSIDAPESIEILLPAASVVSRNEIRATPSLLIRATPGVLSVNGTLVDLAVESTLQDGTSTLEINARGDRWIEAFGNPLTVEGRAAAAALARGIGGDSPSNTSWTKAVTPALLGESDVTNFTAYSVEVVSNETLRLLLPRVYTYDVLLPELIGITVAPELLMSHSSLTLPGAFSIVPTPGTASVGGSFLYNATEAQISFNRTVSDLTLKIFLKADTWQELIGVDPAATAAVLAGIRSQQSEPFGWNAIVGPGLVASAAQVATKESSTELHVKMPFYECESPRDFSRAPCDAAC